MIQSITDDLKNELIRKSRNTQLIEKIVGNPAAREEFISEAHKTTDDLAKRFRFIYLALISSIIHLKVDEIKKIQNEFMLQDDEIKLVLGITFVFANELKKYDVMFYIAKKYNLSDKKLIKSLTALIKELLETKDYDNAAYIYDKYNNLRMNKQPIIDELKKVYNEAMTFKRENKLRDYSEAFKIQKLFKLPKDVLFQKAMDEISFNLDINKYYKAALMAKKFGIGRAITANAAFEAFKQEIERLKKNLAKGIYKNWKKIDINDPFYKGRRILSEFEIYDIAQLRRIDKEYNQARKIAEIAHVIFLELVNKNLYTSNDLMTKIYLAIRIIKDYNLNNDHLFPYIYKNIVENSTKLVDSLDSVIVDYNSGMEYLEPLKMLRELSVLDYEKTNNIAHKIFIFTLEKREVQNALNVYMLFSFRFDKVIQDILNLVYEWAEDNDFDNIFLLMEKFPVKDSIIEDEKFMQKVKVFYDKNIKENKLLKCLSIAETFDFDRSKYINSVKNLIDLNLKNKNIKEAKSLIRKYKLKKSEVNKKIKEQYDEMLKIDKDYAGKIRSEFDLSVFDIGFFKWVLYELIGLKPEKK